MAAGKMRGVRQVSAKEVRELLKLAWVRDEALSAAIRGTDARLLPDGRVLLYAGEGERGTLYPSRATLEEMQRRCLEDLAKGPVDLTRELLPPIGDFLRDVEAHARSLGKTINVADEALDRSVESLDAVDEAMKRIPWAKRQVSEIVTPLVAYVGFVMAGGCGGRWTRPPGSSNEPLIKARDGRFLEPFAPVVLPMVEPSRRIPLRAAVDVYLLPYRPSGAAGPPAT